MAMVAKFTYLITQNTMDAKAFLIAHLPPTPKHSHVKPLLLTYLPEIGGTFSYNHQELQLSYTRTETTVNNTHPEGITKTQTQPSSYQIDCSLWAVFFSTLKLEAGNIDTRQSIIDCQTETERQHRTFSGFRFDEIAQSWQGEWIRQHQEEVFNSTFEYTQEAKLTLNLLEKTGHYIESEYASTAS